MSLPRAVVRTFALIGAVVFTATVATACTGDADPSPSSSASPTAAEYTASYEEAPCPDPNASGFPSADLGPE